MKTGQIENLNQATQEAVHCVICILIISHSHLCYTYVCFIYVGSILIFIYTYKITAMIHDENHILIESEHLIVFIIY